MAIFKYAPAPRIYILRPGDAADSSKANLPLLREQFAAQFRSVYRNVETLQDENGDYILPTFYRDLTAQEIDDIATVLGNHDSSEKTADQQRAAAREGYFADIAAQEQVDIGALLSGPSSEKLLYLLMWDRERRNQYVEDADSISTLQSVIKDYGDILDLIVGQVMPAAKAYAKAEYAADPNTTPNDLKPGLQARFQEDLR